MEGISTLVTSIATILWPIIVIGILVIFRKSVQGLIDSARGRKFTVKIGEMELSMDEFSKQQGDMIKDLQKRVNELQRKVDGRKTEAGTSLSKAMEDEVGAEELAEESQMPENARERESKPDAESVTLDIDDDISDILWVDDNPKNNAFLIDSLHYQGISVSTAANTQEAVERFKHGAFDCVISDSCRHEGKEVDNCQAGFELSSIIRELNEHVPIYIYTDEVDDKMKAKAQDVGATAITSSPSELLKLLSD